MRLLILILLFSISAQGQIVRTHPYYRPTAAACSYLLDQYSGAAAAYSLRQLDCDYAGSAIRVRRSSDNTEQDIGFVNGNLDTAALKTFVGTGGTDDGFVVTWYSQVGSDNATQSTSGQQPKIMDNGVIYRFNDLPTIYFIKSSSTYLSTTNSLFTGANSRSMWAVYKPNTTSTSVYAVCGQSTGTTTGTWFVLQFRNHFATGDPYLAGFADDLTGGDAITTDPKIAAADYDGTTGILYKNNGTEQSAARSYNTANVSFLIGKSLGFGGEYCEGFISEIIVWGSSQSSNKSDIFSNINTYYSIY